MNTNRKIGFEGGRPVLTDEPDYDSMDTGTTDSPSKIESANIPERLYEELAKGQELFLTWVVFRTPACSLSQERQVLAKSAVALFDSKPSALGLGSKPTLAKLAINLAIPKQKLYELYQDYKNEVRLKFRGGETKQRKLAARRRKAKAASDCGQDELPFGPPPQHPYGG